MAPKSEINFLASHYWLLLELSWPRGYLQHSDLAWLGVEVEIGSRDKAMMRYCFWRTPIRVSTPRFFSLDKRHRN